MTHALPVGFTVRPATLDDVDSVMALMAASSLAAVGEADVTRDEVVADLTQPSLDLVNDSSLVHDATGQVVAYGVALNDNPERVFVDVYLHPDLDDDTYLRVGRCLASAALARLRVYLEQSGGSSVTVGSGCYHQEHRQSGLLTDVGMRPARTYWRMRRELDPADAEPFDLPAGVSVRVPDLTDEAVRRVCHQLDTDSFREHHGFVEKPYDQFWSEMGRAPLYDPTQWWLAEVEGAPAGLLIGDESRADEGGAYVPILGVLPQYRGRGVAKALLRTAFAEFVRRGRTTASLGVDSENATGATALYESVGMSAVMAIDFYERVLRV